MRMGPRTPLRSISQIEVGYETMLDDEELQLDRYLRERAIRLPALRGTRFRIVRRMYHDGDDDGWCKLILGMWPPGGDPKEAPQ